MSLPALRRWVAKEWRTPGRRPGTRTDDPAEQRAGKLITGWFESIGLKIKLSVLTDGGIYDGLYNYTDNGKTYAPDFDMYIWGWGLAKDPEYMLCAFITSQMENWNDCCWYNAEYDALYEDQVSEMDWPKREEQVTRMQQIFYQEAPYVVLYYPRMLMAYNTDKWEGWVPYPGDNGNVVTYDNIDTYVQLHPKAGVTTTTSSGSSNTALIVGAVIAALAVIAIVLLLVRRSRGRAVEE